LQNARGAGRIRLPERSSLQTRHARHQAFVGASREDYDLVCAVVAGKAHRVRVDREHGSLARVKAQLIKAKLVADALSYVRQPQRQEQGFRLKTNRCFLERTYVHLPDTLAAADRC
jgi:hypothetical protein